MHLVLSGALLLSLLAASPAQSEPITLRFGVRSSDKPSVVYRRYLPFLEAVQEGTGTRLGSDLALDLEIFRTPEAVMDALGAGSIDFVRCEPSTYIAAKKRLSSIGLLAMENVGGSKRTLGVIAVRADGPIETMANIRGRRFAFGDPGSTLERYLAEAVLVRNDIQAADLAGLEHFSRPEVVFKAVEVGDCDAGAIEISTFHSLNRENRLRALLTYPVATRPWPCRSGLDSSIQTALTETLLALGDPAILEDLGIEGFFPSGDAAYDLVREGLLSAEKFERGSFPQPGGE